MVLIPLEKESGMVFENPANGYQTKANSPWAWCFLFGPLYFLSHGIWTHAIISAVVALITSGISWLVYPLFAGAIVRNYYLSKGWKQVQ